MEQLLEFIRRLHSENQRHNLTGCKSEQEIYNVLICESLTMLHMMDVFYFNSSVIDVGSGAGIPGIPLMILFPSLNLTFLESNQKKCNFIDETLRGLNLDQRSTVICDRAELAGRKDSWRDHFDVGICRALSTTATALELISPFVRVDGRVVLVKGPRIFEEIKKAQEALNMIGCTLEKLLALPIPGIGRLNYYAVFTKYILTPDRFPRRVGLPQKRPLLTPAKCSTWNISLG